MRYLRRSGPTVVITQANGQARLARGPTDPETDGKGGDILSLDDFYADEAALAEQLGATPGWYETDAAGTPVPVGLARPGPTGAAGTGTTAVTPPPDSDTGEAVDAPEAPADGPAAPADVPPGDEPAPTTTEEQTTV